MVSTRSHPSQFPASTSATSTPSKSSTPTRRITSSASSNGWSHTPSHLTLFWLSVSLPLVIWDTGYVLLRPHSMPGGKLHWPIWQPYALYGTIDHVYGFPTWAANDGFCGAQGALNLIETTMYLIYLSWVFRYGQEVESEEEGRGAPAALKGWWIAKPRVLEGKYAARAALMAFSAAVMTVSKTVLYGLNEAFSGFSHVGHNDPVTLTFLWIIPNVPWIIVPSYLIYTMSQELLGGLEMATGASKSKKTR